MIYIFTSSTKGRRTFYRVGPRERERERERPFSCWSLSLISSDEIYFSVSFPFFFSRQENPEHQVHLMTVAPFIVDTGMIQGSIIRFPGQLLQRQS